MKRSTVLWALAVLNVLLLVGLTWKLGFENTAQAQARRGGDYVMVPATVANMPNGVVYMLDTRNGILSGFFLDQRGGLLPMAPIPLGRVFEAGMRAP